MYDLLKRILLQILPDKVLKRTEFYLRYFYSYFYRGSDVFCPVCEGHFRKFIFLESNDQLCPRCGSLPRQRRLWTLIQKQDWLGGKKSILHFSPSRIIQRKMKSLIPLNYTSTEYNPSADTDEHFDITDITVPSESFDIIICYHVLEHIPEDVKAIQELFRICRKEGIVVIQTPFREGDSYENNSITAPGDRKLHFGQEDHVRVFSAPNLKNRLEKAGFSVEMRCYPADPVAGLKDETILWCQKTR